MSYRPGPYSGFGGAPGAFVPDGAGFLVDAVVDGLAPVA